MKKSIQQNPDVQSPNNLPYVPLKKKPKLIYQHQHNSILKQPSVIEQIPGKGQSLSGLIPILHQQKDWVGRVRKVAVFC